MKENIPKPKNSTVTMLKAKEHISGKSKSERTNIELMMNEKLALNDKSNKNEGLKYVRNEKSDKKHVFNILNEKDIELRTNFYELEIEKNKLPNKILDISSISKKVQADLDNLAFNVKVYDSLLCLFSLIVIIIAYLDVRCFYYFSQKEL